LWICFWEAFRTIVPAPRGVWRHWVAVGNYSVTRTLKPSGYCNVGAKDAAHIRIYMDGSDLALLIGAYNSVNGGANYSRACDINLDNAIDQDDLQAFAAGFGRSGSG